MASKKMHNAGKKAWIAINSRKKRFFPRFIRRYDEQIPISNLSGVPKKLRGIYALLNKKNHRNRTPRYDVVYIGMSEKNISRRLKQHARNKNKKGKWTHFSIFEVFPNIYDAEIRELEGLFRVIYREDSNANNLNKQKKFKGFKIVKRNIQAWIKNE